MKARAALSPAALSKNLESVGDAHLADLRVRISKQTTQPFLAGVKDAVQKSGYTPSKIPLGELRAIVAKELLAIQKASTSQKAIDLDGVSRNFGSFAAKVLRRLQTEVATTSGERYAHNDKSTSRAARVASDTPAAKIPGGLKALVAYFPDNAGKLPAETGKRLPHGFTVAQARWFHREYWGAPAYTDINDVLAKAQKDPLFSDRGKIELWQVQNLFKEFPDSFPWRFPTLNAVKGSHAFVEKMLSAEKGASRNEVVASLRKENPNFPDSTAINNYMRGPWQKNPELFPFLAGFPKDADGRVIIEAQGEVDIFATDKLGRPVLSAALAARVEELTRDPRVRYDFKPEDFVALVKAETGCEGFTWATFLNLRKKSVAESKDKTSEWKTFPTWPEVTQAALMSLAEKVAELRARPGNEGLDQARVLEILNSEVEGRPFTANQLSYVARKSDGVIAPFIPAKKEATEKEALELLERVTQLQGKDPKLSREKAAAKLGYEPSRAQYLMKVAHALEPEAFGSLGRDYAAYTTEDDEMLRKAMDRLPIGAEPAALYELLEKQFPKFVERHSSREPKRIAKVVRQRLGIESWLEGQHNRLAKLLAATTKSAPKDSSFAQIMTLARETHPIELSDDGIRNAQYRWKREPQNFPEIAKLLDEHSRFPWDKLESRAPSASAIATRFGAHFAESKKPPAIAAGETEHGFNAAQAKALHRAFWSLPPDASVTDLVRAAAEDDNFKVVPSERQVEKLMRDHRESFPFDVSRRNQAVWAMVFVEGVTKAKKGTALTDVVRLLKDQHPGFPDYGYFQQANNTVWKNNPERFPFLADLPRRKNGKDGTYELGAQGEVTGFLTPNGKVVINEALAKAVGKLCRDERIRYDWITFDPLLAFIGKELGIPMDENVWRQLKEKFGDEVPRRPDIRQTARANLAKEIQKITSDPAIGIKSVAQLCEYLHSERRYPEWDAGFVAKLRADFGEKMVPSYSGAVRSQILENAEKLKDAFAKKTKGESLDEIGKKLGFERHQTRYLVTVAEKEWPGVITTANKQPFNDTDRKQLRAALDHAPIGSTAEMVLAILKTESPEFLNRHTITTDGGLIRAMERELGIDGFLEHEQSRLKSAVIDLLGKSPKGTTQEEFHRILRDDYGSIYSAGHAMRLVRGWADEPSVKKAMGPEGRFPWELGKVKFTPELAERVIATIRQNPGMLLDDYVRILKSDPEFRAENPTFDEATIRNLRAKFPEVPYVNDTKAIAERAKRDNAEVRTLAVRIQKEAAKFDDPAGLTPGFFAQRLDVDAHEVSRAIRRYPQMFPWSGLGAAGNTDLALAARVGYEIERAPLGLHAEALVDKLRKDPDFKSVYPSFNVSTLAELRRDYGHLVPSLAERERILGSRMLVSAILGAKKGTPFSDILRPLQLKHPDVFRESRKEHYVEMWSAEPSSFPFAEALKSRSGELQLNGHGKSALPEDTARTEASRLAREIPEIPERLEVLDRLIEGLSKRQLENFEMVAVQHMFGSQVPVFEALKKLGLKQDRATVVGVPYTSNRSVIGVLRDKGWDVRRVGLDLDAWKEEIRAAIYERLNAALESDRRVLVMDDGGMVAHLIDEDPFLKGHADQFSIVEQTRRGITVAEEGTLNTALVNVAQSLTKVFVEGPMIGSDLSEKLVTRLGRLGVKSLKGKKVGVIGAGAIGSPLAQDLKKLGAKVTVRDLDLSKLSPADRKVSEEQFFASQDIILGATGRESMNAAQLAMIPSGTIIGSCSSKLVEIDVGTLGAKAKKGKGTEVIDDESFPPTLRYHLAGGKTLDVLAQGFPLNFDGSVDTIAPEQIQVTRAMMMLGLLQASSSKVPEIQKLSLASQLRLLEFFEGVDTVQKNTAVLNAVKKTIVMLKQDLAKSTAQSEPRRSNRAVDAA
ncbi:MAG: hypothetical protein HY791_19120 [Deltaproteobacteria bacterium]|nr:hypothetical protein [Deltaproteobacteria bacterium]